VTAQLLPNNEMVLTAWLKDAVPYLEGNVATSLPKERDSWRDIGFVVVNCIGGGADNYNGVRMPVFSLHYYGFDAEGGRPPWNKSAQLAEQVREAVVPTGVPLSVTRSSYHVTAMPSSYKDAKVLNVLLTNEPRRRPGDTGDFAIYQNEIEMHWVVIPGT
jgi:hypothetical protein